MRRFFMPAWLRHLLYLLIPSYVGYFYPELFIAAMKKNMAGMKAVLNWAAANYFPFAGKALVWVQDKLDGAFELALRVALWKVPAAEKAHTELVARLISHQAVFLGVELFIALVLGYLLAAFVIWPLKVWWRKRRDRLHITRDPADY